MQLEEKLENIIIDSLSEIGINTPLPMMSEHEARSLLISLLYSEDAEIEYCSIQETAPLYKALIDFINSRKTSEINFHRKYMFD